MRTFQRVERYPVPKEALREALLNAVAHKDYSSGIPIQISVYDDKTLFWNNGRLPEGWAVERLTLNHQSQPYNPDIANAFFRAGLIEAWGRGIRRIMSSCQENDNPAPVFRYEDIGLWVEFSYHESGISPRKTTGKTREKVISLINSNPHFSINEIAEETGISYHGIEQQIRKLKKEGRIKRIGPKKGGYWEIVNGENENSENKF